MRLRLSLAAILAGTALMSFAASAPAEPKTHTVVIQGLQFVPERLEVAAGDTVVWKNEDLVPHTATAKKVFDSKNLDTGKSWSYIAKNKGRHPYICAYHPTMHGELIVK